MSTFRHWCMMMLLSWTLSWMFRYTVGTWSSMLCYAMPWLALCAFELGHTKLVAITFFFKNKIALCFVVLFVLHKQRREVRDQFSWSCKFEESVRKQMKEEMTSEAEWKLWNIVVPLKMLNFREIIYLKSWVFLLIGKGRKKYKNWWETQEHLVSCQSNTAKQVSNSWQLLHVQLL